MTGRVCPALFRPFFHLSTAAKSQKRNFSNISLGETFVFYHEATKAKGGVEMQSALDRRQAMLELLSDRRQESPA